MHSLKVRRHKIRVSPGHLKRGMPEHLLQMKHGPAAPKIVDCKCVPETMQGAGRRVESQFPASSFTSRLTLSRPNLVWVPLANRNGPPRDLIPCSIEISLSVTQN